VGALQRAAANVRRVYDQTRTTVRARAEAADLDVPELTAPIGDPPQIPPLASIAVENPSVSSKDDAEVPKELRIAAAYAWRLIILAVAGGGLLWAVGRLQSVIIPLAIALLLSALLSPAVRFLRYRAKLPPSLAAGLVLIGGLSAVAGTLTLVVTQFVHNFDKLSTKATDGVEQIRDWLKKGPMHLSTTQLNNTLDAAQTWLNDHRDLLTGSAVATATTTIELLVSFFLVLFCTFFLMRDGNKIWAFLVRIFPRDAEAQVHAAGHAAWGTLGAYVRATVLVALIDATGIGVGLYLLGVPLAFPLAALVFLAAFVPIIGATLSGAVAVLVALVTKGGVVALVVLIIVIAVQQIESHVLQPLIMGRAVAIHPLAVIVAIATGVVVAGIVGALVAVPIVAVLNTAIRFLVLKRREPPPDAVVVAATSPTD
jgi:predicted PurR-regulated permease PerM